MPNRDVSGFLVFLRDYFLGRKGINPLRFANEIAKRTQPPPNLPEGPHAKLSNNYYYSRDARGLVKPNEVLVDGNAVLKLPDGEHKSASALTRTPGKVNLWDK